MPMTTSVWLSPWSRAGRVVRMASPETVQAVVELLKEYVDGRLPTVEAFEYKRVLIYNRSQVKVRCSIHVLVILINSSTVVGQARLTMKHLPTSRRCGDRWHQEATMPLLTCVTCGPAA